MTPQAVWLNLGIYLGPTRKAGRSSLLGGNGLVAEHPMPCGASAEKKKSQFWCRSENILRPQAI